MKLSKCFFGSLLVSLLAVPTALLAEQGAIPGIEDVFSAVLTQHPALSSTKAEINAREFLGDSARAGRYPSLTSQIGILHKDKPTFTLRARQPVWAFGRIDNSIEYADADVLAGRAELLRVKRELLELSAIAYADVLKGYQLQQVIDEDITSHDLLHQQIQRRERGQLASRAETKLAALRLMHSRAQKKRIEGELLTAQNDLQSLTQMPIKQLQPLAKNLTELPLVVSEVERVALKNSATIQHNKRLLDLAKADSKLTKTRFMPTVYLQAEKHNNQSGYADGNKYSLIMDISLDGMGFVAVGKSRAAGAREIAARERLTDARNELLRDIRGLLQNRQIQLELADALQQSVAEFDGILDSYKRQFEAGRKAWLDVLNIQRELTEERLQLARAKSDGMVYTLRLNAKIGSFDELAGPL